MDRVRSLARYAPIALPARADDAIDIARGMIVLGCALALIMAGPVLPL
ncbi:MAG: hypothetical protein ACJLS3_05100 [Erythrobacter sp.]